MTQSEREYFRQMLCTGSTGSIAEYNNRKVEISALHDEPFVLLEDNFFVALTDSVERAVAWLEYGESFDLMQ